MRAKSVKGNKPEAIRSELNTAMDDGYQPTLAIVFISIKQDRESVCEILRERNIDIIGATSSGEFIDGHQSHGEIVLLLLDINKEHYKVVFRDMRGRDLTSIINETGEQELAVFNNPAYILFSTCFSIEGKMMDATGLMRHLGNILGKDRKIFGGCAGDDATFTGTWIFTDKEEADEGFALLVLDHDKIDMYGRAISGWKPLGKVRTVTKAEGEWLYSLDNQPALELYLRGLGLKMGDGEGAQRDFIEAIGLYHPFMAIDAGDPVLRTPLAIDQEKDAIRLDFPIPEGKHLQFTLPPDFDIVETVLENAAAVRGEKNTDADALLVFSCFGRLSALGPMAQEENEGLHKIWKAPMAGFFTYGEFGRDESGQHEFHSTTCSWVALKQKSL